MIPFDTLLCSVLLLVALAVPGYWLGKRHKISDEAAACMGTVLSDVAMPFLVFEKLVGTDLSAIPLSDILLCALLPIGLVILLLVVSRLLFHGYESKAAQNTSCFCAAFSNCGFLGIPLAAALFPTQPQIAVFVSLFNVFSSFMLLTLGVTVLSNGKEKVRFSRLLFRPITAAILAGIAVSHIHHHLYPLPFVVQYAAYPAALTTPLSMIAMGAELSKMPVRSVFCEKKLYPAAAVKLLFAPCVTVLALWLLRIAGMAVSTPAATALFIAAAVSTAATAPAMAKKYGADARLAAVQTMGTTLLCIGTLPLSSLLFKLVFPV